MAKLPQTPKTSKTPNMLAAILTKPGASTLPKKAGKPAKPTTAAKPSAMKFKKPKAAPNAKLVDNDKDGM